MADTLLEYGRAVPDLKRRSVVEIFAAASPILSRLNFIDLADAFGYEYQVEASLPAIGFRALNEEWPEQAEGATVPQREGTAIFGGTVQTDRLMLGRKAGRMARKMKAARLGFERQFFDGDTRKAGGDPKAFDGLNRRLGTGGQTIKAGTNGGYLDLDQVEKCIDLVVGGDDEKVLLVSAAMRRTLAATIRAHGATGLDLSDWAGPLKPRTFSNVEIAIVGEDETGAEILGFDETVGTSDVTGSIYCANFGGSVDEDRLQGIARNAAAGVFDIEEQGVRGTVDQVVVEALLGLAMFHGRSAARYYGILEGVEAAG